MNRGRRPQILCRMLDVFDVWDVLYLELSFSIIGLMILLVMVLLGSGCAAPGARQGTVEAVTRTDLAAAVTTVVENQAELTSEVTAAVQAVGLDLSSKITQTSRTTQEAVVAYNRVDQSTSDKWVNRGLVVGLVALAVVVVVLASYPVGKRRWMRANFRPPERLPSRPP